MWPRASRQANPDTVAFEVVDLSAPEVGISEQDLFERYQIQPVATSFFAVETFFLHLVVETGDSFQVIFPTGDLSQAEIRNAIEAALKRSSSGYLKVVGLWTPPGQGIDQFGRQMPSLQQYAILEDSLRESYELRSLTLDDGKIPGDLDVLILIAPHNMTELQRYAIDQYIMRGGSVIVAAGHYRLGIDPIQGALMLDVNENGIAEMLASYGIVLGESMVLDRQNAPFPMQTQRDLGDMVVTEVQALDYPFFVDIRPDGLDAESSIVSSLPFVTMNWASPVTVNDSLVQNAEVTQLIRSSASSWETSDSNLQPDLELFPELGFLIGEDQRQFPLAVLVEGSFESFFLGKDSPFTIDDIEDLAEEGESADREAIGLIEHSPGNTRLIVLGSSEFINDNVYQISLNFGGDRFASNLQLFANAIDWLTEDLSLASIRSRGSVTRILPPIPDEQQNQWVLMNYAVALIGLVLIAVFWQMQRRAEEPIALIVPSDRLADTTNDDTDTRAIMTEGGV